MRFSLGTIEIDESLRKQIGKASTGRSYFKREDAKEFALQAVTEKIESLLGASVDRDSNGKNVTTLTVNGAAASTEPVDASSF